MRENSVIPVGIDFERADYSFAGNLELQVFGLTDRAETVVYQDDREMVKASFVRRGDEIRAQVSGAAGCRVRLVNCRLEKALGARMEVQGSDTLLFLEQEQADFSCSVAK